MRAPLSSFPSKSGALAEPPENQYSDLESPEQQSQQDEESAETYENR